MPVVAVIAVHSIAAIHCVYHHRNLPCSALPFASKNLIRFLM